MAAVVNLVDESGATSLPHPQEESSPHGRGEEEFERRFSLRLKRKEIASSVKTNPSKEVKPKNVKVKKAEVRGECSDSVKEKRENIEVRGDCSDLVKAEGENIEDRGGGSGLVNVQEKSAHALVKETLRIFNTHYLHFVQEEEKRCKKEADTMRNAQTSNYKGKRVDVEKVKRSSKRPDLKAITKMIETNTILNHSKIIGSLDGVDVGHQFFSRAEMVVIGLHNHWLNGINYMGQSYKKGENYKNYTFPIALSIVMSGQYEDDVDNSEEVVYTGQGGNDLLGNKSQIQDQKLDRGNLALKNSMEHDVPVRVIRGQVSNNSYVGRVYTYDGLYKVVKYWAEKGVSGFTVFKYRLRRLEGQPDLTTNQVNFVRAKMPRSLSELRGLVSEDISGGQENIPIPATNSVDDPPFPPSGYVYNKSIKVRTNVKVPPPGSGCNCHGVCNDPEECACARLNGSDFPYVRRDGGRLVEAKAVVLECGPNCGCGPGCVNRTSQQGLRYRLEVFRTPKKGWAVRSWDHIPAGAPICEYAGLLMKSDEIDKVAHDTFVFEIDCIQTMKGIDGRESRLGGASLLADNVDLDSTAEYCIDAGPVGNVGRFVNHSCQPNLFVQCVLSSHRDIKLARVFLFAADNIPPLQELTYDYGYVLDSVVGPDGQIKKMPCYCGAPDCKKRLY